MIFIISKENLIMELFTNLEDAKNKIYEIFNNTDITEFKYSKFRIDEYEILDNKYQIKNRYIPEKNYEKLNFTKLEIK